MTVEQRSLYNVFQRKYMYQFNYQHFSYSFFTVPFQENWITLSRLISSAGRRVETATNQWQVKKIFDIFSWLAKKLRIKMWLFSNIFHDLEWIKGFALTPNLLNFGIVMLFVFLMFAEVHLNSYIIQFRWKKFPF